ncbi:MAG: hypothetical protein Q8P54_00415 [bacterium]|nr:hypothetical protein [bacterium]
MSENEPTPENPHYNREQVIEVLKKFVEKGVSNPDDLPLSNPEVVEANRVLDSWNERTERLARENPTPGAALESQLSRSTVHVDAGFSDPEYLDEVANDWLAQDLQTAEDQGLTETAAKIQAKRDEINSKLA